MPNACLLTELEYLSYKRSKYQDSKGPHTLGPSKQQRPCHVGVSGERREGRYLLFHMVYNTVYTKVCTLVIAGRWFLMLCICLPWLHLNKSTRYNQ